jgi:hypothetical protein
VTAVKNMVDSDNGERKGRQGQQQRETWQIVTTVRNMVDRTNGEKNCINCTEREKVDRDNNSEKHGRKSQRLEAW